MSKADRIRELTEENNTLKYQLEKCQDELKALKTRPATIADKIAQNKPALRGEKWIK